MGRLHAFSLQSLNCNVQQILGTTSKVYHPSLTLPMQPIILRIHTQTFSSSRNLSRSAIDQHVWSRVFRRVSGSFGHLTSRWDDLCFSYFSNFLLAASASEYNPPAHTDWFTSPSVLAIAIYDALLTLPREVDCIWRQKRSAVTVLYFWQRYCIILLVVSRMQNPFDLTVSISLWRLNCCLINFGQRCVCGDHFLPQCRSSTAVAMQ